VTNVPADTKVSEEGGDEGAQGTRAEIPLQPMVKTMVKQAVPCSPWRTTSEQITTMQPVEDSTLEQGDMP